jgi:hypothetical protein
MLKYNIEGNIDFYDELYKSLDLDDEKDENTCQITGSNLLENYVTMECNHKFNYESLYKEICRQKFDFKTYDSISLTKKDQIRLKESKLDYFIKCPYCRNIQFTTLPYYEELGLEKKYGVNSIDPLLRNTSSLYKNSESSGNYYGSENYTYFLYGVQFKKGVCCYMSKLNSNSNTENSNYTKTHTICSKYVAFIPDTEFSYCKFHYKNELKEYKIKEKNKIMEEKNKIMEEKKKEKETILHERKKLFDEQNALRIEKGLQILKRLPGIKKQIHKDVIENIVDGQPTINQYIPDDENIDMNVCQGILKSGKKKGTLCGCKIVYNTSFCKRHTKENN